MLSPNISAKTQPSSLLKKVVGRITTLTSSSTKLKKINLSQLGAAQGFNICRCFVAITACYNLLQLQLVTVYYNYNLSQSVTITTCHSLLQLNLSQSVTITTCHSLLQLQLVTVCYIYNLPQLQLHSLLQMQLVTIAISGSSSPYP